MIEIPAWAFAAALMAMGFLGGAGGALVMSLVLLRRERADRF